VSNLILLEKIEACREEMISLSDAHPLTSEIVVSTSTRLDKLINEYQNQNLAKNA
jgi:hypothetical protein